MLYIQNLENSATWTVVENLPIEWVFHLLFFRSGGFIYHLMQGFSHHANSKKCSTLHARGSLQVIKYENIEASLLNQGPDRTTKVKFHPF